MGDIFITENCSRPDIRMKFVCLFFAVCLFAASVIKAETVQRRSLFDGDFDNLVDTVLATDKAGDKAESKSLIDSMVDKIWAYGKEKLKGAAKDALITAGKAYLAKLVMKKLMATAISSIGKRSIIDDLDLKNKVSNIYKKLTEAVDKVEEKAEEVLDKTMGEVKQVLGQIKDKTLYKELEAIYNKMKKADLKDSLQNVLLVIDDHVAMAVKDGKISKESVDEIKSKINNLKTFKDLLSKGGEYVKEGSMKITELTNYI